MRKFVVGAAVIVAAVGVISMAQAEEKKTIKQVMKEAHGGGQNSLLFKVAGGKGTKEDAEKLLGLYKDLASNEPKKGEKDAWKMKAETILKEAENVVKGDKDAGKALQKAANCANCHKEHK